MLATASDNDKENTKIGSVHIFLPQTIRWLFKTKVLVCQ
jgi:hypothetical protein